MIVKSIPLRNNSGVLRNFDFEKLEDDIFSEYGKSKIVLNENEVKIYLFEESIETYVEDTLKNIVQDSIGNWNGPENKRIGFVPIGAMIPILRTPDIGDVNVGIKDNFVKCNGQTISDSDSIYDGVTIPDLTSNSLTDIWILRIK